MKFLKLPSINVMVIISLLIGIENTSIRSITDNFTTKTDRVKTYLKNESATNKYHWLFGNLFNWSAAKVIFNSSKNKLEISAECNIGEDGIYFTSISDKDKDNFKNYFFPKEIDGKKVNVIDFANFQDCDITNFSNFSNSGLNFKIRLIGGSSNYESCEIIPVQIQYGLSLFGSNKLSDKVPELKEACTKRKEDIKNSIFDDILEEEKEEFINQVIEKRPDLKSKIKKVIGVNNSVKAFKEVREQIIKENKNVMDNITNDVTKRVSTQTVFAQEKNFIGPVLIIPNKYKEIQPNLEIYVVNFEKKTYDYQIKSYNVLKKMERYKSKKAVMAGNFIASIKDDFNFNIETVTIELRITRFDSSTNKDVILKCKSLPQKFLPRTIDDVRYTRFFIKPEFNCPDVKNGVDYIIEY